MIVIGRLDNYILIQEKLDEKDTQFSANGTRTKSGSMKRES